MGKERTHTEEKQLHPSYVAEDHFLTVNQTFSTVSLIGNVYYSIQKVLKSKSLLEIKAVTKHCGGGIWKQRKQHPPE